MFHVLVKEKPSDCSHCPLKQSVTRECGEVKILRETASGINYYKVPDRRCRIKSYQTESFFKIKAARKKNG